MRQRSRAGWSSSCRTSRIRPAVTLASTPASRSPKRCSPRTPSTKYGSPSHRRSLAVGDGSWTGCRRFASNCSVARPRPRVTCLPTIASRGDTRLAATLTSSQEGGAGKTDWNRRTPRIPGVNERRVPSAIRNVAFPVVRRGYERRAVDAYVTRINRLIAELEATHSPRDAVEHALERTEDERDTILARARETAAQIIDAAEREAEELLAAARAEAADIVVDASAQADSSKAEATDYVAKAQTDAADQLQRAQDEIASLRNEAQEWLQELRADTERVWNERRELVEDLRGMASRLQEAITEIRRRSRDAASS